MRDAVGRAKGEIRHRLPVGRDGRELLLPREPGELSVGGERRTLGRTIRNPNRRHDDRAQQHGGPRDPGPAPRPPDRLDRSRARRRHPAARRHQRLELGHHLVGRLPPVRGTLFQGLHDDVHQRRRERGTMPGHRLGRLHDLRGRPAAARPRRRAAVPPAARTPPRRGRRCRPDDRDAGRRSPVPVPCTPGYPAPRPPWSAGSVRWPHSRPWPHRSPSPGHDGRRASHSPA